MKKKVQVMLYLDPDLRRELKVCAAEECRTMTALVADAISVYLDESRKFRRRHIARQKHFGKSK